MDIVALKLKTKYTLCLIFYSVILLPDFQFHIFQNSINLFIIFVYLGFLNDEIAGFMSKIYIFLNEYPVNKYLFLFRLYKISYKCQSGKETGSGI